MGATDAGVGPRVGNDDPGHAADEVTDAATELRGAVFIDGVVEAHARGDRIGAVDRTVVADAKRGLKAGVGGRLFVGGEVVVAHAEGGIQAGGDVPAGLAEEAVDGEVADVVGGSAGDVEGAAIGAGKIGGEIGDGGVVEYAIRVGAEEIYEVALFAVKAAGEGPLVEEVFAGAAEALSFDGDEITLAVLFGAEDEGAVGDGRAGVANAADAEDAHFGEGNRGGRGLGVFVLRIAELGLEIRRPLAEELAGPDLFGTDLHEAVGGKIGGERSGGDAGATDGTEVGEGVAAAGGELALGLAVADGEALAVGDVPIELGERDFVELADGGGAAEEGAEVVGAAAGSGGLDGGEAGIDRGKIRGALRGPGGDEAGDFRADGVELLVVEKEEETVFQDGAAEREALGFLFEQGAGAGGGTEDVAGLEIVVRVIVVGGTVILVRAALGDGVDGGAGEAALADVVGRNGDVELLDGVEGDGIAEGLEARAVEAELVVDAGAVDLDGVEAIVLSDRADDGLGAAAEDAAEAHEGSGAGDVGERALHGCGVGNG